MALTLPRWILAAAAGTAAVWLGLFHVRASRSSSNQNLPAASTPSTVSAQAGAAMTTAADRLRLLEIRDSILREPIASQARTPVVVVSPAYGGLAGQLDSLVRSRWAAAGVQGASRVIIAAVLDSATAIHGAVRPKWWSATSITAFMPDSGTNTPCLSVLRVPVPLDKKSPAYLRRDLVAPETIGALIGPCLYYAAFGAPGPSVARWLRDGGWRLSHVTDWQAPPPPLNASRRVGPASYEAFVYQPRDWTTTTGLGCLAGESGACTAALLLPARNDADTVWRSHVVSAVGANENLFRFPRGRSALGLSEGWLLSEMVRTLGRERFASFWRSSQPLDDAFRAAANESLDAWVHDWAVRTYGPLPIGAGVTLAGVVAGVSVLILAAITAAMIAGRRRVA